MAGTLTVKSVTKSTWPELEALFEGRGGPSYCWCMPFRKMENRAEASNEDRKAALKGRVDEAVPIGLVGYIEGEPVAWCSVGPRESFATMYKAQDDAEAGVWSVTCFFIRRDHRGKGLSAQMLAAAIEEARGRGAKVIEGYPVDPDSPSYRFMGFLPLYAGQGFTETGREGKRRHVMRLVL